MNGIRNDIRILEAIRRAEETNLEIILHASRCGQCLQSMLDTPCPKGAKLWHKAKQARMAAETYLTKGTLLIGRLP